MRHSMSLKKARGLQKKVEGFARDVDSDALILVGTYFVAANKRMTKRIRMAARRYLWAKGAREFTTSLVPRVKVTQLQAA